jgi:outer membrane protein OmpA-like peptidoglycan-associated protein
LTGRAALLTDDCLYLCGPIILVEFVDRTEFARSTGPHCPLKGSTLKILLNSSSPSGAAQRRTAYRVAILAVMLQLGACNPVETWQDWTGANKNDPDLETTTNTRNPTAGEPSDNPNLTTPPPNRLTAAEREKLTQGLIADRTNAKYSDEKLRAGFPAVTAATPPPPPPPVPAATEALQTNPTTGAASPGPAPTADTPIAVIKFAADSTNLSDEDHQTIEKVVPLYQQNPGKVRVIGYAGAGSGGLEQLNSLRAALDRAQAVAAALTRAGIPSDKIVVEAAPAGSNSAESRAEVLLEH